MHDFQFAHLISVTCVKSQDVAMVFDGSTSMGIGGFWSIKRFAIDMIQLMDVGPGTTRVCLVKFSLETTLVFNLTAFFSSEDMEYAIDALVYSKGASGTYSQAKSGRSTLFQAFS